MRGVIYKYTSPSNKVYVGKTTNEKQRKLRHQCDKKERCVALQRAFAKYGYDSFTYEVIEIVEDNDISVVNDKLSQLEQYYIAEYKSNNPQYGYNLTKGGEGMSGYHHSKESRQKMREAKLGRTLPEEHKKKIMQSAKGKKKIAQCDMEGNIIAEFNSIADASRCTNIKKATISYQLNHSKKTTKNKYDYIWMEINKAAQNIPSNNAIISEDEEETDTNKQE